MTSELSYETDFFRPGDAPGVVELYRTVYGENYPVRSVYDPEEIIRQAASGETYRMVARSADGQVIGHMAIYRSVPPIPNRNLYEAGQLMVRPDYRQTPLGFDLFHACATRIPQKYNLELWGEAVCNHLFTQQMAVREGFVETALEMDLMPESAYNLPTSQSAGGRVSALSMFNLISSHSQTLFLPGVYTGFLRFIYEGAGPGCPLETSVAGLPHGIPTEGSMVSFKEAGIARITVRSIGQDFAAWIEGLESDLAHNGIIVTQVFMPLTVPWTGAAVEILRKRGYFLGGALFHWFGDDGFFMQKHANTPNFEGAHMYTKRAKKIKELVYADWKEVTGQE